jgi:hypothetical protein
MKVKPQIAHQVPGRIRMKIPSAKGNPAMLEEIQKTFAAIPGIEEVVVNPCQQQPEIRLKPPV